MLFELVIKDFILIKETVLEFKPGLNMMTGETGAGKSMVLGALNLILGNQATKDLVRIGADRALVKASFYVEDALNQRLLEMGCSIDETVVVLSREVQSKGKSIARINGTVVTLLQLKSIAETLLNIHGQSENQVLLERDHQLQLLDAFSGEESTLYLADIQNVFKAYKQALEHFNELQRQSSDSQKQVDYLSYQIEDIENAALKIGEDDNLEKEFERLKNLDNIVLATQEALSWVRGEFGDGAQTKVSKLASTLEKYSVYDEKLVQYVKSFREVFYILEDLGSELDSYTDTLDHDGERLVDVEKRLDTINRMKAKYGHTVEDILSHLQTCYEELRFFETLDDNLKEAQGQLHRVEARYLELAEHLSAQRVKASKAFVAMLIQELNELNMKDAQLEMVFEKAHTYQPTGMDKIDMLISTNLGQPFKSLKKVVSGGELSRIMLGLKIVLGKADYVPTLIFDEIDAGISGHTANVVGEKLYKLALNSQVICITHLPQIAVFADHHLCIEKANQEEETVTKITLLKPLDIEKEIQRLVGGTERTDSTKQHANEMLRFAQAIKESLRQSTH